MVRFRKAVSPLRLGFALALAGVSLLAGPATAQERMAKVKSAPQDYRGRLIRLEGEVLEIRGISPRSERGVYRLVDESDPVGVMVRTERLPTTGGPFLVSARLAPELLLEGILFLDEADRDLIRGPTLLLALILSASGLILTAVFVAFYLRTRGEARRLRLGPPMWLIPSSADHQREAEAGPTARFDYRLHYVEEEHSTLLDRRKLRWLVLAGGGAVVAVAGGVWLGLLSLSEAAKPSFVLMATDGPTTRPAVVATDSTVRDTVRVPRRDDTLRVGLVTPPPAVEVRPPPPDSVRRLAARRDSIRLAARRDSIRLAAQRDSARAAAALAQAPRETAVARPETAVVVTVPPPPPPVAVVSPPRDTVVPAPRPDPELIRRAAEAELRDGIVRFVGAITAKQPATVGALYQTGADPRWRGRFLEFVRETGPTAALGVVEAAAVTGSAAEAPFAVAFRWRGDFGVDRRKTVRFAGTARRSGDTWAFEGARLLEAFP
jgi:hypothetical protein